MHQAKSAPGTLKVQDENVSGRRKTLAIRRRLVLAGNFRGGLAFLLFLLGSVTVAFAVDEWQALNSTPFGDRSGHVVMTIDEGSLLLLGGESEGSVRNDVWTSTDDGASWSELSADAGWPARRDFAAVQQPGGNIYVMGGRGGPLGQEPLNSVWQSSDGGQTWEQRFSSPSMSATFSPRHSIQAAALANGDLLVFNGEQGSTVFSQILRSTDDGATWSALPSPGWGQRREMRLLHRIDSGPGPSTDTLYLMGGHLGVQVFTDLWVSENGGQSWSNFNPSPTWPAARGFAAARLDGPMPGQETLMMTGGEVGDDTQTSFVWSSDNPTSSWQRDIRFGDWPPRRDHSATLLSDGRLLIIGGTALDDDRSLDDVIVVDWQAGQEQPEVRWPGPGWTAREQHRMVLTQSDELLVIGGRDPANAQVQPDVWRSGLDGAGAWEPVHDFDADSEIGGLRGHAAARGPDGYIYVFGGVDEHGESPARARRSLDGQVWSVHGPDPQPLQRIGLAATRTGSAVVLAGGQMGSQSTNQVWRWLAAAGTYQNLGNAAWSARYGHAMTTLPDGRVVLAGGTDFSGSGSSSETYNDVWISSDGGANWQQQTGNAPWEARHGHALEALPDGRLILLGGRFPQPFGDPAILFGDVWLSEDAGVSWIQVTAAAPWGARSGMDTELLPNGDLLLAGGRISETEAVADVWRLQLSGVGTLTGNILLNGEPVEAVEVAAIDNADSTEFTTTTSASGGYQFNLPAPATYTVSVSAPFNTSVVTTPHPDTAVGLAGDQSVERDFSLEQTGPLTRPDHALVPDGAIVTLDVLANDLAGPEPLDPDSIQIDGTNAPGEPLIVAGQGRWEVLPGAGKLQFFPAEDLDGNPDSVAYRVRDTAGQISDAALVSIDFGLPEASLTVDDCRDANPDVLDFTTTVAGSPNQITYSYWHEGVSSDWQFMPPASGFTNPVDEPGAAPDQYSMGWDLSGLALAQGGLVQIRLEAVWDDTTATATVRRLDLNACQDLGVPVVLAWVDARQLAKGVDIRWATASEVGNLGFRLLDAKDMLPLHEDLIESKGVDLTDPAEYQYKLDTSIKAFFIEDMDVRGRWQRHGPFAVGSEYGQRPQPHAIDWSKARSTARGAANDWKPGRDQPIHLETSASGLHRFGHHQLETSGINLVGTLVTDLALTHRGEPVPFHTSASDYFSAGDWIEFVAADSDSLYTAHAVYKLHAQRPEDHRRIALDTRAPSGVPSDSYTEVAIIGSPRRYSFSAPVDDPWYDRRLSVQSSPRQWSYSFEVDALASAADPARLTVKGWGITSWADINPDHHIQVFINDQLVADHWFNGRDAVAIEAQFPVDWLVEGDNVLTLKLPADTGAAAAVMAFQSARVDYPRKLLTRDAELVFRASGEALAVAGELPQAPRIYRVEEDAVFRVYAQSSVNALFSDRFEHPGDGRGAPALLLPASDDLSTWHIRDSATLPAPAIRPGRVPVDLIEQAADYLIISHPEFIEGLAPLIAHHQAAGLVVRVVDVRDIHSVYSGGHAEGPGLQQFLREAADSVGYRYVLLVGGDTYDYRGYLGSESISFVPTVYAAASDLVRFAPSDGLLVDLNGNGVPDRAIGRLPVRTATELEQVVSKTLSYTERDYRQRLMLSADQDEPGLSFRQQSERLRTDLGPSWLTRRAYLDELSVSQARAELIQAMDDGQSLVAFSGHSAHSVWTFSGLFSASDVDLLGATNRPTVVMQWGCWNTYHVGPTYDTLGHRLMLSPQRGAAAVVGSATFTSATSSRLLGEALGPLLADPEASLGTALTEAKQSLPADLARDVIIAWTLLGDPALRVAN